MIRSKTRWKVSGTDPELARNLAEQLNLHPVVARLLVRRGIETKEQAERFLHPDFSHLHDPMRMKGMPAAVERIRQALEQGQKIRVFGDYDADGVSGTALMVHLLRSLEARFDYAVPHRFREGYGLNTDAVRKAKQDGVDLIITVDNGIRAVEPVALAGELGVDVIVTDHHEPPDGGLPDALALINPRQQDCPYPFKHLAGAGVAFKLAQALLGRVPEELAELAAIGTVADLMPLVDENRVLVCMGLKRMQHSGFPGIRALLRVSGVDPRDVNAHHIGFALGPRINASGRLEDARRAVECLIAGDETEADRLALEMDRLNRERQEIVEELSEQAERQIEEEGLEDDAVLLVAGEHWNQGVVGIVAARLLEKYGRPSLVFSIDPETGTAKGSARSIPVFDIHAALCECAEWLEHFGGHRAAAGMTLRREHLGELRRKLCALAREWIDPDYMPETEADMACSIGDVSLELIEQIGLLAPFGAGNEPPRFIFPDLAIRGMRTMGKDLQHLKITVSAGSGDGDPLVEAVAFGQGHLKAAISETSSIELLGGLSVNEWNGTRKPQIIVQDLRINRMQVFDWRGGSGEEKLARWLALPGSGRRRAVLVFSRSHREIAEAVMRKAGQTAEVWTVSSAEQPVALHQEPGEHPSGWESVTDLLLYSFPDRLSKLASVLKKGDGLERVYAVFIPADSRVRTVPSRESLKQVYALLRRIGQWQEDSRGIMDFLSRHSGLNRDTVSWIIDVFLELEFLQREGGMVRCVPSPAKKELCASGRYRAAMAAQDCESVLQYSTSQELTAWMLAQRQSRDVRAGSAPAAAGTVQHSAS